MMLLIKIQVLLFAQLIRNIDLFMKLNITVLLNFLKLIFYYIFIWIGYYLALYVLLKDVLPQFTSFYFIPKRLVRFIGRYSSFFFKNSQSLKKFSFHWIYSTNLRKKRINISFIKDIFVRYLVMDD